VKRAAAGVRHACERFNDGDLEAAMALVTDDLEMTAPGSETVTGSAHTSSRPDS